MLQNKIKKISIAYTTSLFVFKSIYIKDIQSGFYKINIESKLNLFFCKRMIKEVFVTYFII